MSRPLLRVAVLFPELMDLHGDSSNARVLKSRADWEGIDLRVSHHEADAVVDGPRPDAVIVGSTAEEDLPVTAMRLARAAGVLHEWYAQGTEVLALGTGWDLLADTVEWSCGRIEPGLGIFSGEARLLPAWVSGVLAVQGSEHGEGALGGYENHARGYRPGPGEHALGAVVRGIGNGDRSEGAARPGALGTHLHGPVLSNNPALADALLDRALQLRHGRRFEPLSPRARLADELSSRVRQGLLRR